MHNIGKQGSLTAIKFTWTMSLFGLLNGSGHCEC